MRILTATAIAAMLALGTVVGAPNAGHAQWGFGQGVSVGFPPPPLPVYDQPPIPDDGYLWTPGYWAWDPNYGDYYWVPGTWALPPEEGLLWTPAWWGWADGGYLFHPGYWGTYIGYYGGIDYGFGYTGYGYQGGYWRGRAFFYNSAVNNVRNVRGAKMFERPVMRASRPNRVSYSGGMGGVVARPTPEQITAMRQHHFAPTADQTRHVQMAGADRSLSAKVNHGEPPIAATPRPASFGPPRQAPPPADYQRQGGPPQHTGDNPGYRPAPTPRNYPAATPNYSGAGGPPPRQPSYPPARAQGYHPPSPGAGGFAPPPRQAAPPQPVRSPPPQPPHSAEKKNEPPH